MAEIDSQDVLQQELFTVYPNRRPAHHPSCNYHWTTCLSWKQESIRSLTDHPARLIGQFSLVYAGWFAHQP